MLHILTKTVDATLLVLKLNMMLVREINRLISKINQ